jgi:hypothetical protein
VCCGLLTARAEYRRVYLLKIPCHEPYIMAVQPGRAWHGMASDAGHVGGWILSLVRKIVTTRSPMLNGTVKPHRIRVRIIQCVDPTMSFCSLSVPALAVVGSKPVTNDCLVGYKLAPWTFYNPSDLAELLEIALCN